MTAMLSLMFFILSSLLRNSVEKTFVARRERPSVQIVGGVEAEVDDWRFLVQIEWFEESGVQCGGLFLNPQWILTAANCLEHDGHRESTHVLSVDMYTIDLHQEGHPFIPVSTDIAEFYFPEKYATTENGALVHDIGLIQLYPDYPNYDPDGKTIVTATISRKKIPPNFHEVFTNCRTAGWGETTHDGDFSHDLLTSNKSIMSTEDCVNASLGKVPGGIICATDKTAQNCNGDSGAPLVCHDLRTGQDLVVAIFSFSAYGCKPGDIDYFTDVGSHWDWIQDTMENFTLKKRPNRALKIFLLTITVICCVLINVMMAYFLITRSKEEKPII